MRIRPNAARPTACRAGDLSFWHRVRIAGSLPTNLVKASSTQAGRGMDPGSSGIGAMGEGGELMEETGDALPLW